MRHNRQSHPGAEAPPSRRSASHRLGPVLFVYVLRHALRPAGLALAGLTAALLAKDLLGLSDLLINRGLGLPLVAQIIAFQAVPMLAHVLPFAVAIGLLAGLGRLSRTLEMTALEACGVAPRGLLVPVAAAGCLAASIGMVISIVAAPAAARQMAGTLARIHALNPAVTIRAGVPLAFGNWRLQAREASHNGRDLRGVLLWIPAVGDTIFAERGHVRTLEQGTSLLSLRRGTVLRRAGRGVEQVGFDRLDTRLPGDPVAATLEYDNPLRKLDLAGLAAVAEDESQTGRDRRRAALERQRRFAFPLAAAALALLAVPLFLHIGRPQGPGGAVLGLLLTLVYYGLVQLGEGLATGQRTNAAAAAWLPNAVLAAAALGALLVPTKSPSTLTDWGGGRVYVGGPARYRPRRRPLGRYIVSSFALLTGIAFAVLLAAYLVTDILERLDWFERHGATWYEILRFYGARTPLLASRMVPMAFLTGAALTLSQLSARGELTAIRACGIAAGRALAPMLVAGFVAMPAAFALSDWVVPRTNALADEIKVTEIKDGARKARSEAWYRAGNRVFRAETLDRILGRARELSVYEINAAGLPTAITDAAWAFHEQGGTWVLQDAVRYELSTQGMRAVAAPERIDLGGDETGATDTMHLDSQSLAALIAEAGRDGYDTTRFRVDYHARLAGVWACLVLPAALLFVGVAGRILRRGPAFVVLLAIGLGVGYVLLTDAGIALGYAKVIPPPVAGWGVTWLYGLGAGALATRFYA